MIDLFTRIYTSVNGRNPFLKKIYFYSTIRMFIRIWTNIIVPIYLKLTSRKIKYQIKSSNKKDVKIIVSLTSFPARIKRTWIVIESLLRQTVLPDRIILWLSEEQFPTYNTLPKRLLELQNRGLEIVMCKGNLLSHKKYYYSIKNFPNDIFITVDDDVMYPSTLIVNLLSCHKKYPTAICCNMGRLIKMHKGKVLPYKEWRLLNNEDGPDYNILQIGKDGVLYPPNVLHKEVLNKDIFMKYCKYADDIWLNIMARMNGTKIVKTNYDALFLPILNKKDTSLASVNLNEGMNERQLNNILEYYKIDIGY